VSDESPKERVDRELGELLQELRVALPGVQVLFGFLLTVPFSNGFTHANEIHRMLLLIALLTAALSICFLVAPAAQHRILFRAQSKTRLLKRSNLFAITGVVLLAASISVCVVLVVDYLFHTAVATVCAALIAAVLGFFWLVQPLWYRARQDLDDIPETEEDEEPVVARR
jgi:4-amino-4-deoxy-L-arabinose transferase-like glycosyltransferase